MSLKQTAGGVMVRAAADRVIDKVMPRDDGFSLGDASVRVQHQVQSVRDLRRWRPATVAVGFLSGLALAVGVTHSGRKRK